LRRDWLQSCDTNGMTKTVPPNWISSSLLNKRKLAEPLTLLELTCSAAADGKGMHSTKEVSMPRIVDASESASRASQYLPSWKRAGRHQAIVDFVSAGSRFKLYMPKENTKVTFVLAGVRAPRTARNATEKPEPYGAEAYKFASKYLQRDVEIGEFP
jgi:endonuclease YncB( thermonuclease family)